MTGKELYTLNTNLLGGFAMDETLFYQLLNAKKDEREMSRDWMILRSFYSSVSFASSDEHDDTKALPDKFLRVYDPVDDIGKTQPGVFIVGSGNDITPLSPIKFSDRFKKRDRIGNYYLDFKNSKIGRTGATAGTLHLYFLQGSDDITKSASWIFPTFAHVLLAYDVAVEHKGGIDWDTVNANQVPFNLAMIRNLENQLAHWDARLQQAELGV